MMEAIQTPPFGLLEPHASTGAVAGAADQSALRWRRIAAVVVLMSSVFYVYEHDPEMYAGGARSGVREDRLLDKFVDEAETGSTDRKIALVSFGLIGLYWLFTCKDQRWNVRWFGVTVLACLLMWVTLSVGWSDESGISLRRLIAVVMALLGCFGVARLLRPDELVAAVLFSMGALVSASFLIDIAAGARPWQTGYRFAGTLHANSQAAYCGVLCLAAQCFRPGVSRSLGRLGMLGGLAGIVLTKSRTGLIAVLFGMLLAKTVRLRSAMRWAFVATAVSFGAFVVILIASLGAGERAELREAVLMGRTEQAGSLTGRVPLWQRLSGYASKRLMAGYGYQGFWTAERLDMIKKSEGWTLQSAHNAYLEITLQIGLIGLGMILLLLLLSARAMQQAFELTGQGGYAFAIGVFGFGLVDGLLQSHFAELELPTAVSVIAALNVLFFFPEGEGAPVPPPSAYA